MKIISATSTLIAVAALLPSAILAKKDDPHRLFHPTRSKAAKAQAKSDPSAPPYNAEIDSSTSKAGKATDAKSLKEFLPKAKAHKAAKSKCLNDEADLTDFDLMLDFSSLSMSMSMSYMPQMGKSAKASAKCHKLSTYDESADYAHGGHEFYDGHEYYDDWDLDDDWYPYDDFYYMDGAVDEVAIIKWFLQMLSDCASIPLDYDSCMVQKVIDVLASGSVDSSSVRNLRAHVDRKLEDLNFNPADDAWCTLPQDEEVQYVVDEAFKMCEDSYVDVPDDEYLLALKNFIGIFQNKPCNCGYISD